MAIKTAIHSFIHRLFFPGVKIPPKLNWKTDLNNFGQVKEFSLLRDTKKITAVLVSPRNTSPIGTVIFAHPISRKAKYFFSDGLRIKNYLNAGYRVVLFDFNGFGESDRIDLYFWKDTQAVINYVKQRFSNEPIILHGVSFGSFHVIRAIPALPQGSKIILENTNRSLYDYWKHWPHTAFVVRALEIKFWSPRFVRDMNIIEVFKELQRPDLRFLFITCSNDKFTPRNEMEELAGYLNSPKTFLHTENTKHLEAPVIAEQEYANALLKFLEG